MKENQRDEEPIESQLSAGQADKAHAEKEKDSEEKDLSAQVRVAFQEYLEKRAAVRKSLGNLRRSAMFETLPS